MRGDLVIIDFFSSEYGERSQDAKHAEEPEELHSLKHRNQGIYILLLNGTQIHMF